MVATTHVALSATEMVSLKTVDPDPASACVSVSAPARIPVPVSASTSLLANIPRTIFLAAAVLLLSLFIAALSSSYNQTINASQVAFSFDDFSLVPQKTFHTDDTVRSVTFQPSVGTCIAVDANRFPF